MMLLGVDAALGRSGLCVLECDIARPEQGRVLRTAVIQTNPRHTRQQRLVQIYQETLTLLDLYPEWNKLDHAFIEKPGSWARVKQNSTQTTVEALAQARAAVMLALSWDKVPVEEITADVAKISVGCGPKADKETVAARVAALGLYCGGDQELSDAVAVAVGGATFLAQAALIVPKRRK